MCAKRPRERVRIVSGRRAGEQGYIERAHYENLAAAIPCTRPSHHLLHGFSYGSRQVAHQNCFVSFDDGKSWTRP